MAVACIWRAPFTTVELLDPLSVAAGGGRPYAITPDGATVFGTSQAADFTNRAARWASATLAVTELQRVDMSAPFLAFQPNNAVALGGSDDGTIIYGGSLTSGGSGVQPIIRWTGGGASGSLLSLPAGATFSRNEWGGIDRIAPFRLCSPDGSVNAGFGDFTAGTKWVNGAPVTLSDPSLVSATTTNNAIVLGYDATGAIYWNGTTPHRLAAGGSGVPLAYFSNSDVSVIWCPQTPLAYWDISGGGSGTFHQMNYDPGGSYINWVAVDPGVLIAVGNTYFSSLGGYSHACQWIGITISDLGVIPGGHASTALGCNHDGTLTVGWSNDASSTIRPVYWDAANTLHVLPTLAGPDDLFGKALGISRDGSVIFGEISPPPPPPPSLPAGLAELFFAATAGFVNLSVAANRRSFISDLGGAPSLGADGSIPLSVTPQVFLSAALDNPSQFAVNNGRGGAFAVSDTLVAGDSNPPPVDSSLTTPIPGSPGRGVLGDYRTGNLYAFNPNTLTDHGTARRWLRRWRALPAATSAADRFAWLLVNMMTGIGIPDGAAPHVSLRWSDDGGHTWSDERIMAVGPLGETNRTVKFNRLGATRRYKSSDRTFELSSTDPFLVAILDAMVGAP